jgi:hypothetical protein
MAEAREAADDHDVSIGGERLFDHLPAGIAAELAEVVEGPEALHLTYRLG